MIHFAAGKRKHLPVDLVSQVTAKSSGHPAGKEGHQHGRQHGNRSQSQHLQSRLQHIIGLHLIHVPALCGIFTLHIGDGSLRNNAVRHGVNFFFCLLHHGVPLFLRKLSDIYVLLRYGSRNQHGLAHRPVNLIPFLPGQVFSDVQLSLQSVGILYLRLIRLFHQQKQPIHCFLPDLVRNCIFNSLLLYSGIYNSGCIFRKRKITECLQKQKPENHKNEAQAFLHLLKHLNHRMSPPPARSTGSSSPESADCPCFCISAPAAAATDKSPPC